MNIEKVKYPNIVCKFKQDRWEVSLRNCEALPNITLDSLHHTLIKALFAHKADAVRRKDRVGG